jgi:dolichyl-phosphate-mannose-protein mannosyltransferase
MKKDLALLTISRFILLDSMLLFFTALSAFCLVTFRNFRHDPFSDGWWFWMAATGASIGCVTSIKWVGLFAIALVGLNTVQDLWEMFGDLQMPKVCLDIFIFRLFMLDIGQHGSCA